ncbi:hypothetical protein [Vibrio genomosp. F10]|uniref:hypothetical protein n=1 Tax=Vibrio genomosp. F10 TaxID=723171 RepID=UPI00031D4B67|nr:hypothetical protein [Vibrio genomosp. F10]OEE82083.1 hypothetical protein A1QK_04470 [Vibrio genomosp. F10 str. 9ZD137]
MKIMKINGLIEALELAQHRVSVRTMTPEEVYSKLKDLQTRLDEILYKKDQVGLKVCVTVYTKVAASYQGAPQSTFVQLERGKSNWKLLNVYRDNGIPTDLRVHNLADYKIQVTDKLHDSMQRIITD